MIPLVLLFSTLVMRGYEEKSKRYQEASKAMNTTMVEYVNGIKVIKAFNKSASSFGKFKKTVNENKNAMLDWYLSVCFSMNLRFRHCRNNFKGLRINFFHQVIQGVFTIIFEQCFEHMYFHRLTLRR